MRSTNPPILRVGYALLGVSLIALPLASKFPSLGVIGEIAVGAACALAGVALILSATHRS